MSRISYNMSELCGVINLTNFQEFSTVYRKPVDNPAALRADKTDKREMGREKN